MRPSSTCARRTRFLAATTDCNSLYCRLDPREGARIAVAEAARNLTCSGAVPLAVTDNLNFGNPYKPENFWQLREAVEGLAEACRAFDTPVTGGNVSLYNESPAGVVDPTPTVGMVGLIEREEWITTQFFKAAGDVVILLGDFGDEMGGSHYLQGHPRPEGRPAAAARFRARTRGAECPARVDPRRPGAKRARLQRRRSRRRARGILLSIPPVRSARRSIWPRPDGNGSIKFFSTNRSRAIVISTVPENAEKVLHFLQSRNLPARRLGTVGGDALAVTVAGETLAWPLARNSRRLV